MYGMMRRQPRIEWNDAGRREATAWRRQQEIDDAADMACAFADSDSDYARIEAAHESAMEEIENENTESGK